MKKYRKGDIVKINFHGKITEAIVCTPLGEGVNVKSTIEIKEWNGNNGLILGIEHITGLVQKREDIKKWWKWL